MKQIQYRIAFFAAILACLWMSATLAVERGKLPMASDLRKEARLAREKQIPILILFSAPGCGCRGGLRGGAALPDAPCATRGSPTP